VQCTADSKFPSQLSLPEASAAAEVELLPGKRELAVVADSGNDGRLALLPLGAAPGTEPRFLNLTLDAAGGDDIEGMAFREGALYTLTSSGVVRRFVPDRKGGLSPDGPFYPIGMAPYSCARLTDANCGKNWEGLCLRAPSQAARCAGYAASKQEGALYCVVLEGTRLQIDTLKPPLKLNLSNKGLADCAFGAAGGPAEGVLVVTTNVHAGSRSYVIDEATGALRRIDVGGHISNEAIAIDRDGALYQFMDDNRAPSAASRMVCTGW
jgi:hypothetical protein